MLNRRDFLVLAGLAATGMAGNSWATDAPQANESKDSSFSSRIAALEAGVGGRLGVHILEADSARQWGYRADERFPMCSTFKFLAAAAVLNRVDQRKEKLSRHIVYGKEMLVPYSPATEKHAGAGMAMASLCEAAMTLSDNTAANLMLESMGGPVGLTDFVRTLGDKETRLDRNEPTLNEAVPGDPRDTTTPQSMTADMAKIVLGSALSNASRKQITDWLLRNKTGDKRVRAGLPQGWKIGDKTGTGRLGTTNTVGVVWPPQGKPLLFAVYLTECKADEAQRNAVHAEVGKLIAQGLAA